MASQLFKTITDKYLPESDDEVEEKNQSDNSESSSESESESSSIQKSVTAESNASQSNGAVKQTFRGNAAQLNLDTTDDDDDDDDDGPGIFGGRVGSKNKPTAASTKGGIYSKKITETKQHVKVINHDFVSAEKGLMTQIENETRQKVESCLDDDDVPDVKKFKNSAFSDESDDDELFAKPRKARSQQPVVEEKNDIENQENLERDLSPPPPPVHVNTKSKRKSTTIAEKQLRELEAIQHQSRMKKAIDQTPNTSVISNSIDDVQTMITVRVASKSGFIKLDMNEDDTFQPLFEEVAAREKKDIDSIMLTLNDRIIKFNDTPAGINLKSYHIIDCVQNMRKPQERIRIVEQDQDVDELTNGNSNVLTITLQTQEGRKSRLTFLVFKDEKFINILKKYCEKRSLDNHGQYMLEFDGDRVEDDETPNGLDLDGGEIFDVKSSKAKTTLQHVNENQSKYEFDDDVLIA